jgi:hypothetical protein
MGGCCGDDGGHPEYGRGLVAFGRLSPVLAVLDQTRDVGSREKQTGGSGGSLEPPGPLS